VLVVTDTDCAGSCKSNYHTITTMTAPKQNKKKEEEEEEEEDETTTAQTNK
jgi:hypothetical protein